MSSVETECNQSLAEKCSGVKANSNKSEINCDPKRRFKTAYILNSENHYFWFIVLVY